MAAKFGEIEEVSRNFAFCVIFLRLNDKANWSAWPGITCLPRILSPEEVVKNVEGEGMAKTC